MKLKEYTRAHEDFDKVIEMGPDNPDYLCAKAQCFFSEGPNEDLTMQAISFSEKALE